MQRIMIIGCGGSGKSTLSKRLSTHLGLPNICLDQYFWKPGWVEVDREEWQTINKELVARPQWVMDGNYGSSMDLRIPRADTIIFLHFSTFTCLSRVLKRTWKNYGKSRPSMMTGCPERFSPEFYHYILMYNRTRAPGLLKRLKKLEGEKQVFVLRNDQEVEDFWKKIVATTPGANQG